MGEMRESRFFRVPGEMKETKGNSAHRDSSYSSNVEWNAVAP